MRAFGWMQVNTALYCGQVIISKEKLCIFFLFLFTYSFDVEFDIA